MLVPIPPLACKTADVVAFLAALSHLPGEVQREVLEEATKQIVEALETDK